MAYSTPRTWTAGEYPTAVQMNANVRDNVSFLANPPACRVYNNATQNVPDNGTLDPVLFNTESFDTDSMHSTSSFTGRITINTAGVYQISAGIQFTTAADYPSTRIGIYKNAGVFVAGATAQNNTGGNYESWLTASAPDKLTVADFLYVVAYQDNTANVTRTILANTNFFSAVWMGLG